MSHREAQFLVCEWSAHELAEVRQVWFPAVSAGFADYRAGHRENTARTPREVRIEETGWIMWVLCVNKPAHFKTLKRAFMNGEGIGLRARHAALDAFARAHEAWSSELEENA
jgi:hypothetical protein